MNLIESLKMRWVTWVWNHTPNCAEISRLTSLSLDRPLSLRLQLKMRLHHLICAWCKRYEEHLKFLHHAAPLLAAQTGEISGRGLSPEARLRIVKNLVYRPG